MPNIVIGAEHIQCLKDNQAYNALQTQAISRPDLTKASIVHFTKTSKDVFKI